MPFTPPVSAFGCDGEVIHDRDWLLGKLGCLQREHDLAFVMRVLEIAGFVMERKVSRDFYSVVLTSTARRRIARCE